jgi:hypothetical protein
MRLRRLSENMVTTVVPVPTLHCLGFLKKFGATDTLNTKDMPDTEVVRILTGG